MRVTPLVAALLAITLSGSALAQEWIEYSSRQGRFTGNFPSQPRVTTTTYQSPYGANLPARVYSASEGPSRNSVKRSYSTRVITGRIVLSSQRMASCPSRYSGAITLLPLEDIFVTAAV